MKKVLVITSVASMVDQFLFPSIQMLQELGYEVHVACNFAQGSTCSADRIEELKNKLRESSVLCYHIDFARDVTKVSNHILAYKQVNKLIDENKYELVHCHSPIGGLITRLACRKIRRGGVKVFYTAHGFHFYKGAPLKNWLLYFPAEWLCAHFTDVLITINQEDYALAKKCMKAKKVVYVPGVGIDLKKFADTIVDREKKRKELGIPSDSTLLLSVGELNKNKNHQVIIRAIARLKNPKIRYIIAGTGEEMENLMMLANNLGVGQCVSLLGYRTDIAELCCAADIFCFPSHREGLGLAALEAMACGLKVIAAENRGTREFIFNEKNGILCQAGDMRGFAEAIDYVMRGEVLANAENNMETLKVYSVEYVISAMRRLYLAEMES